MIKEFREFIMRGNVLDLAVGIIIGAAFTAVVGSLVNDIINPILGILLAGVNLSNIVITLREATVDQPAVVISIGAFINAIIQFVITALVIFLIVKSFNEMRKRTERKQPEEAAPPAPTVDEKILTTLEHLDATLQQIDAKVLPPST
jgi:large conductance mechanosensitive channel